ncbi:hypothetical protein SALBM135S_00633 [Streptomyces alboniger]
MATSTSGTSKRTLYRLTGVAPTVDAMFDVLDPDRLEAVDAELHVPEERLGVPTLLVTGSFEQPVASWCGEVMDAFARKVAAARPGKVLAEGFRPSKVTFAILLKRGTDLTADTLFPFSQVTLVQTAKLLEAWGVEVEVIGIQAATVPQSRTGIRHLAA